MISGGAADAVVQRVARAETWYLLVPGRRLSLSTYIADQELMETPAQPGSRDAFGEEIVRMPINELLPKIPKQEEVLRVLFEVMRATDPAELPADLQVIPVLDDETSKAVSAFSGTTWKTIVFVRLSEDMYEGLAYRRLATFSPDGRVERLT